MKQGDDFWKAKIAAFLSLPPYRALLKDAKAFTSMSKKLLEAVEIQAPSAEEVEKIHRIAGGLDIPPFVKDFSPGVFRENPLLVHPLSGKHYPLTELQKKISALDLEQLHNLTREAVEAICKKVKETQGGREESFYKRLFLALWRKLPEMIREQEKQKISDENKRLGYLWEVLPADSRIPTHSIWDHNAIASAIAAAMPHPALLIFDIGSVQEFIKAGRRTQDAWMASFLISYLMWKAMKSIADELGPDCLIFPNLREQPLVDYWLTEKGIETGKPSTEELKIANFPERFTAIVPEERGKELAEEAMKKLMGTWKTVAQKVKDIFEAAVNKGIGLNLAENTYWNDIWDRQREDFIPRMGVYWSILPWKKDSNGEFNPQDVLNTYTKLLPGKEDASARQYIEGFKQIFEAAKTSGDQGDIGMMYPLFSSMNANALNARKTLRDFEQRQEPGWKCSQCGVRQALQPDDQVLEQISKKGEGEPLKQFWEQLGKVLRGEDTQKLAGRIRRGDRLCAVCLVKRLALEAFFENKLGFNHHLFPSTASIAATSFKAAVIEKFIEGNSFGAELPEYVGRVSKFLDPQKIFFKSSAVPKLENLLRDIKDENKKNIVENFLRIDGDWLYEESFDRESIIREYGLASEKFPDELLREAKNALQRLLAAARGLAKDRDTSKADDPRLRAPSRYYAVLAMDGDKMGDWVSGIIAPEFIPMFHPEIIKDVEDRLSSVESKAPKDMPLARPLGSTVHLALSTALKNFALHLARWAVEEQHHGKLIYAGGDDVLAFVPVSDLFPVMQQLRALFQGRFIKLPEDGKVSEVKDGFAFIKDVNGNKRLLLLAGAPEPGQKTGNKDFVGMTASLGAAVVHHSHPLTQAIEEAFQHAMKDHAKEKLDRDAFAVHLLKRAGGPLEVGMKWYLDQDGKESLSVLDELSAILGYFREGKLSSRLAYDLATRSEGLGENLDSLQKELGGSGESWIHKAQGSELTRLVKRHIVGEGRDSQQEKNAEVIIRHCSALLAAIQERIKEMVKKEEKKSLEDFTGAWETMTRLLLLTRFIAAEE